MNKARQEISIKNHHAHGGGGRYVPGVIHIQHRDGRQRRVRRIDENDCRDRRHGIDEEIDRDIEDSRKTNRDRDARKQFVERLLRRCGNGFKLFDPGL